MSPSEPPAERYLQTVCSLSLTAPRGQGEAWRARLHSHLEEVWRRGQAEREHLSQTPSEVPEATRKGLEAGLFVTAIGLFALGHLDVAPMIAGYAGSPNLTRLRQVLFDLLPLPPEAKKPRWPADRIAEWLFAHQEQIVWNEAERRYVLA